MRKVLFLILFLVSCGSIEDPCLRADYTTKHGICVAANQYPIIKQEVEYVTDYVIDGLAEKSNFKRSMIELVFKEIRMSIEFVDEAYSNEGVKVMGVCNNGGDKFDCRLMYRICLGRSALGHELIHLFLIYYYDDYTHRLDWLWDVSDTLEQSQGSLDRRIKRELSCERCEIPFYCNEVMEYE